MHEETFGPVLPVVAFDTLEDAISMANDSDYGLTSSIYTQNLNVAMKGIGGADGKHGLHEYLQTQVVYLQS